MRPSIFHRHESVEQWPGEQDVHGRYPRPRYHEFTRQPGETFVLYADKTVTHQLIDPEAVYTHEYGALRDRPHIELKVAEAGHWIYGAVPYFPTTRTRVLWWRRPRQYADDFGGDFPFTVGQTVMILYASSRLHAFTAVIQATSETVVHNRPVATGYLVVETIGNQDAVFA